MKPLSESLRNVRTIIDVLKANRFSERTEIKNITYKICEYKSGTILPDTSDFEPYTSDITWGTPDGHAWFHFTVTPEGNMKGKDITLNIRTDIDGWDANNPQFIAYVDGEIRQGLDTNHTYLLLSGKDSYDVFLYGYTGPQNSNLRLFADMEIENEDVSSLYYDMSVPFQALEYLNENSYEYQTTLTYLDKAVTKLNLLSVPSEEFYRSVKEADEFLKKEFYAKHTDSRNVTVIAIGHTHIDVAWLWTLEQTREKAQRSFATVIELMKHYPEYKFMSSQAVLYKMVKEECPALYEEIKKMIKAGRWEVEGAMWVEADCNLSSGESLIRQVQYGKNFFKDEFDKENRVLWLPDVFGYAAALPQILKKSEVDWFVTSKIGWNDTNTLPYDTFKWRGLDGTEINTYFLTTQKEQKGSVPTRESTYCPCSASADFIDGTWNRYQQKNLSNEAIITFGFGDGGGGPTKEMLEQLRRTKNGIPGCAKSKIDFAGNFLTRLEKKMEKDPSIVPVWQGELYLEYHRGTYTSQARNKKNNRVCEFLALDTEYLYTMLEKLGYDKFPKEKLREIWEIILVNQFHDVIPGSSIVEVYERSDKDYALIEGEMAELRENAFEKIADNVCKEGYVVFNPHSFVNSSTVKIDEKSVFVENIPPKGYKVVTDFSTTNSIVFNKNTVTTPFFKVKFDKNFNITSIYDKKNHREVVKHGEAANRFIVLSDYPDKYDAWEIQRSASDKVYPVDNVSDVSFIDDGARCGIHYVRKHLNSEIEQTIWFYENLPKIDFETKVDWHEKKQALKVSFPVDINSDRATYEIQFGTIERPTHFNTSWDQAKFEVCGHKYADLSEGNYGVSLINDCKYGYDIHNSDMRLTLLKSAMNPDNVPEHVNDQGIHTFTYSIYPHKDTLQKSDTVRLAYDLNLPMSVKKSLGKGTLPSEYSFVSVNRDNVVIETIKKGERTNDTVIRMYETKNSHTRATVRFGFDVGDVYLGNISEKKLKKLSVKDNSVTLDIKPFEIVTLILD